MTTILDAASLRSYLGAIGEVRTRLGGEPAAWRIREVGDGNLNLVFIVEGVEGSVCVKQALPYVRAAGPSWPMSPERIVFERAYFETVAPYVGARIPTIYHFDREQYCLVMERLSPHIILRHGLIAGRRYPNLARDLGDYVARACGSRSTSSLPTPIGSARAIATPRRNWMPSLPPYAPMRRSNWRPRATPRNSSINPKR